MASFHLVLPRSSGSFMMQQRMISGSKISLSSFSMSRTLACASHSGGNNPFSRNVDAKFDRVLSGDRKHPRESDVEIVTDSKKIKLDDVQNSTGEKQLADLENFSQNDGGGDLDIYMGLDDEYFKKIKSIIPSQVNEDVVERSKQMAEKAAALMLHAAMLQQMGQKLLDQSRASLGSII